MSQLSIRAAMELALQGMVGIIPAVSIVSSANSVFRTATPHNLPPGVFVKIEGHTNGNGHFVAVPLTSTTFSLKDVMDSKSVVKNTSGSGGTVTAQLTAWENVAFVALNNTPFQKVDFVFARPDDITMGTGFYRERGFMQVSLYYPLQTGPGAAMSRAELLRSTFPRGASFSNNSITVHIDRTAEIMRGMPTDESYIVIVRIPFYADIFS